MLFLTTSHPERSDHLPLAIIHGLSSSHSVWLYPPTLKRYTSEANTVDTRANIKATRFSFSVLDSLVRVKNATFNTRLVKTFRSFAQTASSDHWPPLLSRLILLLTSPGQFQEWMVRYVYFFFCLTFSPSTLAFSMISKCCRRCFAFARFVGLRTMVLSLFLAFWICVL